MSSDIGIRYVLLGGHDLDSYRFPGTGVLYRPRSDKLSSVTKDDITYLRAKEGVELTSLTFFKVCAPIKDFVVWPLTIEAAL